MKKMKGKIRRTEMKVKMHRMKMEEWKEKGEMERMEIKTIKKMERIEV